MSSSPISEIPAPAASPRLSLSARVQLIESEIEELYQHIKKVRLEFDQAVSVATLRSREQAAEILNASPAQVGRWTASRELAVVELDRRPRYRLQDIESFAAARVRGASPPLMTSAAPPGRTNTGNGVSAGRYPEPSDSAKT